MRPPAHAYLADRLSEMAKMSDYLESALLNHVFRGDVGGTALTQPPSLFVAIFKSDTSAEADKLIVDAELESGSLVSEISSVGTGYVRVAATFTAPVSEPGGGFKVDNVAQILFPTAIADWQADPEVVSHFAVLDALAAGNVLAWGRLDTHRQVFLDDALRFPATQLDLIFR